MLTNKYREESVSGGFGINTSLGENISRDISVSANYGKTSFDCKSVTEQAGIYAGKEGFDIKVENNTDLKGAVIASEADADKNTLTTGTISFSDIKNEAEYDTKGICREVGISIPIGSDYDGRVVVVKNGIATAQLSAGVSKTVDISDYLKKIREFIINNQTTQGRSIADEIVPQGS